MSVTSGFFNSMNGDRKYNATHFGHCFDGIIRDGILGSVGDCFAVNAHSGMTVHVGTGKAWYLASWLENDALLPLTLDASDVVLDRIDVIVMEFNTTDAVRQNSIKVVKGTAASSPAHPTLTKTKTVLQVPLAYIRVKANATAISQSLIYNQVGKDSSPLVTSILEQVSIQTLITQWEAQFTEWTAEQRENFTEWFNGVKSTLEELETGEFVNTINTMKCVTATLAANKWTSTEDGYTQVVDITGMTSAWRPGVPALIPDMVKDKDAASIEAWACVSRIVSGAGTLTFTCFDNKPAASFSVRVPGLLV